MEIYFGKQNFRHLLQADICIFIVVGAALTLGSVTDFSDMMILAMSFPNIIGLIFLAPVVKEELHKYLKAIGKESNKESA